MSSEKVWFSFFMILALTLNFGFFIGELDDLEQSVERVAAATAGLGLLLRPFVNQGQGDPEFSCDGLGAGVAEGAFQDLMGFHGAELRVRRAGEQEASIGRLSGEGMGVRRS